MKKLCVQTLRRTLTIWTVCALLLTTAAFAAAPGYVETNPDGSTTTTTVGENGAVIKTPGDPSGKTTVVTTQWSGKVTETVTTSTGRKVETENDPAVGVTITVTEQDGQNTAEITLPAALPDLAQEERFIDVSTTHWADEAIHHMAALGLVQGTDSERRFYNTTAAMTRGELTQVLYRLSGSKAEVGENTLGDAWYAPAVAWAAECGLLRDVDTVTFSPQRQITREELCALLYRYANFLGMDSEADLEVLGAFPDGSQVSGWAEKGLAWCVGHDLVHGKGVGESALLDPGATITRAEVAVLLENFIGLLK